MSNRAICEGFTTDGYPCQNIHMTNCPEHSRHMEVCKGSKECPAFKMDYPTAEEGYDLDVLLGLVAPKRDDNRFENFTDFQLAVLSFALVEFIDGDTEMNCAEDDESRELHKWVNTEIRYRMDNAATM